MTQHTDFSKLEMDTTVGAKPTETATPRTDAFEKEYPIRDDYDNRPSLDECCLWVGFAHTLERELAALQAKHDKIEQELFALSQDDGKKDRAIDVLRTQLAQAQNEALESAARVVDVASPIDMASLAEAIRALKSPNSAEGEPG